MKTTKLLITLYVFLASFLFGGIALANDSGIFGAVTPSALSQKSFPGNWQFKMPRGYYGVGC
jgi:hypothetical protein